MGGRDHGGVKDEPGEFPFFPAALRTMNETFYRRYQLQLGTNELLLVPKAAKINVVAGFLGGGMAEKS